MTTSVKESASQTTLAEAFAARKRVLVNRASAVFPLRLRRGTDFRLLFLDYWKIKNSVADVVCNIRVYDCDGNLKARESMRIENSHNDLSIRDVIKDEEFDGMMEAEFISPSNIGFAFPGIIGLYQSGYRFSLVHSAGRIKNPDEAALPVFSEETNWDCKFSSNTTPVFHVFAGPSGRPADTIRVRLFSEVNEVVREVEIKTGLDHPFSSRLFRADEIFSDAEICKGSFISVVLSASDVFSRLVVGNLHIDTDHLEVTHSFPVTTINDYIKEPAQGGGLLSFLPAVTAPELALEVASFPTNAPSLVIGTIRKQRASDSRLQAVGETLEWATGGSGSRLELIRLGVDDKLLCVDFTAGLVPSRLNASYRYSVRGTNTPFSSDLATGAKSWVYPPKHSHWGHGILGGGFETVILLRNISHVAGGAAPDKAVLDIYWGNGAQLRSFQAIASESGEVFHLSRLCPELSASATPQTLSWFMKTGGPYVETFFVCFAGDGRICAEHGF